VEIISTFVAGIPKMSAHQRRGDEPASRSEQRRDHAGEPPVVLHVFKDLATLPEVELSGFGHLGGRGRLAGVPYEVSSLGDRCRGNVIPGGDGAAAVEGNGEHTVHAPEVEHPLACWPGSAGAAPGDAATGDEAATRCLPPRGRRAAVSAGTGGHTQASWYERPSSNNSNLWAYV